MVIENNLFVSLEKYKFQRIYRTSQISKAITVNICKTLREGIID